MYNIIFQHLHTYSTRKGRLYIYICLHVCSVVLVVSLSDPMDCSPPGSSVHGILQSRIREWVAISSSRGSSQHRDQIHDSCISCIAGIFFNTRIGTPLQYSYLENSIDRGVWWITFHGVAKNQIQQNKHIQNHKIQKTG